MPVRDAVGHFFFFAAGLAPAGAGKRYLVCIPEAFFWQFALYGLAMAAHWRL
jgi:hypothetical protein